MEFIWILFAFICGLASKSVSLPPSIGYLFAGFLLHFLGFQADDNLQALADLGITLMLFTIGLKLNVKDLFKPEIWLASLSHTLIWVVTVAVLSKLLIMGAVAYFADLDFTTAALIAFALSFSSTVCVVKLLEEQGEMKTRHGKLAIGILVMQDIVAVIFLVLATGKTPSIWAPALLVLVLLRPLLSRVISHAGHGELMPLGGFFLALGSYELFELVNIKGDLGALLIGMLLATHPKATEISKSLLSFKDIFLIGFFLTIGFTALPDWQMLGLASALALLLPVKFVLFFLLLCALKIRCRTAYLSALGLSNYSEFGLIVTAISVKAGWLANEWLVILALAVSISFVLTNVLYRFSHIIFARHKDFLRKFERSTRLPEDVFEQPEDAPVIVIGMGRVGMGAYQALSTHGNTRVWGMDADKEKIKQISKKGMQACYGDGEDAFFWENIDLSKIHLILLALPSVQDSKSIASQLKTANYQGQIAAIARYDDEREELIEYGIDKVFNFYTEAGVGFAEESFAMLPQAYPEPMGSTAS
ncbi:cation:proton antiporter family protein [Thalassomonas actiniarum]|uniref:Cation:proton antiporter n=1 Tax=Thalassomonas actiniarum TaxID=485447 RepID=A0AAE9YXL9_9GAMM|nr:cation:proton antiporter family protein [Thalassomonas actiniarum]WDE01388.1 cation:proton antiporter [Thalassomonas actiniarum]